VTAPPSAAAGSDAAAAPGPAGDAIHPRLVEGEVRVIGYRWSPRVHALKAFLTRSRVPFRWLDIRRDRDALATVRRALPDARRFPVVLFPDGTALVDPELRDVAERLGLPTQPDATTYDLIVVGGGPAGLTASIYAASEGLRTVIVEQDVPGGQVSFSAYVENYPGFPEGLSGSDLGRRTVEQAERFGVDLVVTRRATGLRLNGSDRTVTLDDRTELTSRVVLLATGVSFRWLEAPGCPSLVGAGIYYGAVTAEATACEGQDVYVLGGGNSAGQAALLLARYARHVTIVAPEPSIEETMSAYLVSRIRQAPNITVRTRHTVIAAAGERRLRQLTLQQVESGETEQVPADALFVFIGATPRTDWLGDAVARDDQGFILAGRDPVQGCNGHVPWPLEREPYPLETSAPGVFVAGDVHRGSVKRLAAAVGEGATAVQGIHRYLRQP
jgi:thioredoxin reductase (NADPH)